MKHTVLLVDDDKLALKPIQLKLIDSGYNCFAADNASSALVILDENEIDLIVSDYKMPIIDGAEFFEIVRTKYSFIPFIMITAYATVNEAVSSIKSGVFDYIPKPFDTEQLIEVMERALKFKAMENENKKYKKYLNKEFGFGNILTKSPQMGKVIELAKKVVDSPNTTIAIYGESGVGKEIMAKAIHFASNGLPDNFIAINCAAIPEALLETELFGHVKGAFTTAESNRTGVFELVKNGTVLLDEIGDMPISLQTKMLRVLQERVFQRVGSNMRIQMNCRVIVATHRNLAELVDKGLFRSDLFYRINVYPLKIPPLRDRMEDIFALVDFFLEKLRKELGKPLPGISKAAMKRLMSHNWPGNIRELKNTIERAAILTEGSLIQPEHFNFGMLDDISSYNSDSEIKYDIRIPYEELSLDNLINCILRITLDRCGNNKTKAAEILGIDRITFYRRLAQDPSQKE